MTAKIKLLFLLFITTNGFAMLMNKSEVNEYHPYEVLKNFVIEKAEERINKFDFDRDEIIKNIMEKSIHAYVLHEKRNLFSSQLELIFKYSENEALEQISLGELDKKYIKNAINRCIKDYIAEEDEAFIAKYV